MIDGLGVKGVQACEAFWVYVGFVSMRWRSPPGNSIVILAVRDVFVFCVVGDGSGDLSVYDSQGANSTSKSWWLKVCACSPSLGAEGAAEVWFFAEKENTPGLDCCVLGSSNLSRRFKAIGAADKLRIKSKGVIKSRTR